MALESIAIAAGTGVSAYGSIYKGQAEKAAADYNAAVLSRNAGLARGQASADARDKERENNRYLGALRAAFGANGIAFEGSALDIFEDQAAEAELATRRIRYGGELRALGLTDQATLERMKGKTASTAGLIGAAAQIVGGVSSYARLRRGVAGGSDGSY